MPSKTIICLACSRKKGGNCIAGKLIDENKWIRPVSSLGPITDHQMKYSNGDLPKVLDKIKIPIGESCPNKYQPENYLIEDGQWEKIGEFNDAELDKLCNDYPIIFFNYNDRVPENLIEDDNDHSLMFIKVNNLKLIRLNTSYYPYKRIRANFEYNGFDYDIQVTDKDIENEYLNQDVGEYNLKNDLYYLCLSLGNPYEKDNHCYKFVASIIKAKKPHKTVYNNINQIKVKIEGKEYLWDGSKWIDLKTFIVPPQLIIEKLNKEIEDIDLDYSNLSPTELVSMASNFKDNGNFVKALEIIEYILCKVPGDPAILSILCSLLRKNGKPDEALLRTSSSSYANTALLTSRAAAMCDLEQWENAKKEVGRALAINRNNNSKNVEAFNVVKRIKEHRPELYK